MMGGAFSVLLQLEMELVDHRFIANEMQAAKFSSCVIIDVLTNTVIGVLDYKPENTVYLSLMMIDFNHQQSGVGRSIYNQFEESLRQFGKNSIHITFAVWL